MNRRMLLALAGGLSLTTGLAVAQTPSGQTPAGQTPAPQRIRLRGRIDSVSGDRLEMTTRDGAKASVTLPQDLRVNEMTAIQASDIKDDSYVGVAARPGPDGTLQAIEVTVFPASARGSGEGHFPWDQGQDSTMTNGSVGSVTRGTVGHVGTGQQLAMKVQYKGGEKQIVVPEGTPIVTFSPGSRALLVPGGQVVISGTRGAGDTVVASNVIIGKDGLVPPN